MKTQKKIILSNKLYEFTSDRDVEYFWNIKAHSQGDNDTKAILLSYEVLLSDKKKDNNIFCPI